MTDGWGQTVKDGWGLSGIETFCVSPELHYKFHVDSYSFFINAFIQFFEIVKDI